jgi:GT2 family glycosyltransferase
VTAAIEPELTVVIPTLGRVLLRRCLESLAAGSVRPAEVVVVDQGRVPEIEHLAREYSDGGLRVTYIPSIQTGRSAGLNTGIARVRTTYVAITDDDCVVAPEWAARIVAHLRALPRTIVTGRVEAGDGDVVLSVSTSTEPDLQRRPRLRFDRLSGGNMALPLSLLQELGPFEEDPCMRTAEDAEYAYRALRAGVTLAYVPDAVVSHLGWRDAAARDAQYRSYGFSQGGFYGRYLRQGDMFIALRMSLHLFRSTKRWVAGVLRRDRDLASNGRAYAAGLLPGVVAGWRSPLRTVANATAATTSALRVKTDYQGSIDEDSR